MATLFEQIGETNIRKIIEDFYDKAFMDPLISHFFFSKDKRRLIEMQVVFSAILLGSKNINIKETDAKSSQWSPIQKCSFRQKTSSHGRVSKENESTHKPCKSMARIRRTI